LVVSLLFIASLLFVIVAMVGNKADYATLTAICVFAGVVDVIADGLRLVMMLTFASVHVDTSLAMIVPAAMGTRTTGPECVPASDAQDRGHDR